MCTSFPSSPFIQGFVTKTVQNSALPPQLLCDNHSFVSTSITLIKQMSPPCVIFSTLLSSPTSQVKTLFSAFFQWRCCESWTCTFIAWHMLVAVDCVQYDSRHCPNCKSTTYYNETSWHMKFIDSIYETSFSTSQKTICVFMTKTELLCYIGEKQLLSHVTHRCIFCLNTKK